MRCVLVILAMLCNALAFCQNGLIVVCDSLSKAPLAFAHISTPIDTFYADADGRFPKERVKEKESTISYLGYFSKKIDFLNLKDTINLKSSSVLLNHVDIGASNESFEIGFHKLKKDASFVGGRTSILTVKIDGTDRRVRIEEIIISFRKLYKGFEFNVFAFEVTEQGLPGMLLFSDSIIVHKATRNFRVDVKDLMIELPDNGIFIGFKIFDGNQAHSKDLPHIATSHKSIEPRMYFIWEGTWREYDLSSIIAPYFPVLMIGLKVKPI